MKKSNNQIIKEIIKELKLKGKEKEVAKILFFRYLKLYETRMEAKIKTEKEIRFYLMNRKNKKLN